MKQDTELKPQKLFNQVRTLGINPNHWYPVGWADQLKPGQLKKVTLWLQDMVVMRSQAGGLSVLENACLHKGVELHLGEVKGNCVVCPYHGWEFDQQGQCTRIPYARENSGLPRKKIRRFPVQEKYNIIWVFPGDAELADSTPLPDIPEYDDPDWLTIEVPATFQVHYSLVNENPLDVFHGHLHKDLQGWYDPVLKTLERDDNHVHASYDVTFKNGWLPRFLGITESKEKEVLKTIEVGYYYPHCRNTLPGTSNYYFMRSPAGPDRTNSFSIMCLKVRLPGWLVRMIRKPLSRIISRFVVKPFLIQDIEVMESEQRNYLLNPDRRYVEINPVIAAAQRLTLTQYQAYHGKQTMTDDSEDTAHQQDTTATGQ